MPNISKFTQARREQILEVLQIGGSRATAAAIAGVGDETLRTWLKRGQETAEPESGFAQFYQDVLAAEAAPRYRALGIIQRAMPDKPDLAWKFLERKEPGYAPPMPGKATGGPQVQVNLSLTGSTAPLPTWIEAEVVEDAQEVPAITDGSDPAPSGES